MRLKTLRTIPAKFSKKKGSITVYMTLSGILIFALLGTLVETGRYTICAGHGARTLRSATEALFTEYSLPLYEQYGLFFIEEEGPPYEEVIAGYAADTFHAAEEGDMDFWEGEIQNIQVKDKTYLGDNKAEALQKEITQYMARKITVEQVENFLSQSEEITKTEEKATEIEEQVEKEEELAELDEELISLMELVDGIVVDDGDVSCKERFVKMFATGKKKGQNFGVTEAVVWKKMKKKLDDTPKNFEKEDLTDFEENVKKVLKITEKAIEKADKLKDGYSKFAGEKGDFSDYAKKQTKFAKSFSVLEGNKVILEKTKTLLKEEVTSETKEKLTALWKDYDTKTISFDYTGVEETGGGENPLDSLSSAWEDGILSLVCEDAENLPEKEIKNPDKYSDFYGEQPEEEEDYGDRVSCFADEEEVSLSGVLGDMTTYAKEEFCLDSYIQNQFSSLIKKKEKSDWKQSLDYQWEYIVAGKDSDKANLTSILNRILLIRTAANFFAIYKDSKKKSEAYAAAAAVVGFTGLEPLIRLTQTLILIVWSFVESLVDIAGILQGRHVPLVKKKSDVLTTFPEIFLITGKAITKRAKKFKEARKTTFGYKEYLMLFMAATSQSVRRYRIMDLIETDMRKNGYKGFQLGRCIFSVKVRGQFSFPSRFFRMTLLENMLGRDVQFHHATCEVTVSYL